MTKRQEVFVVLLMVLLLAALGVALWRQQRMRELQDSGAAERPSCRPVQYAQENAGRPASEPVVMAPSGSGHPGGAAPFTLNRNRAT
jgi:hypothetical protein